MDTSRKDTHEQAPVLREHADTFLIDDRGTERGEALDMEHPSVHAGHRVTGASSSSERRSCHPLRRRGQGELTAEAGWKSEPGSADRRSRR